MIKFDGGVVGGWWMEDGRWKKKSGSVVAALPSLPHQLGYRHLTCLGKCLVALS
jgi:hypothetical protein